MKKGHIELNGMRFHAFHGCLQEEREHGNEFIVDFSCSYDLHEASRSDRLEDTVDYSAIYSTVSEEMERPSNLLENVAGRIAERISSEHPGLADIRITVSKKNPPVGGECEWARVSVEL